MAVGPRARFRLLGIVAAFTVVLAACGDEGGSDRVETGDNNGGGEASASAQENAPEEPLAEDGTPPPVTVRARERSLTLEPWGYCYDDACIDAAPPESPPDVGDATEVEVEFPLEDWLFTASFSQAGDECGRSQEVPVQLGDDGTKVVEPAGFADTYDVTLFGRGDGGDLVVTFRWTTPEDGTLATPEARLAVLDASGGELDSHNVELHLDHLARTPERASATVTVSAPDGRAVTLEPALYDAGCPEGSLSWRGPAEEVAAELVDELGPFTYEVELVLDGVGHRGEATWPDDVIAGLEPFVALTFDPPLPALAE